MIWHPGRGDIRAAIVALADRGVEPSCVRVQGELMRARGVGASRRDVLPVLAAWRSEQLAARSGPIEAAAQAIAALATPAEVDAVRRRVRELTGGGQCRLTVSASNRPARGRRRKATASHRPLHGVHE